MSKICNNCGKEVKDEFDFCVYCGSELPKHYICPDCKEEYLEIDYEYCGKCGDKLVSIDEFKSSQSKLMGLSDEEKICYNFWSALFDEAEKSESKFLNFRQNFIMENRKLLAIKGISPAVALLRNAFSFKKDQIEIKLHIHDNKDLYYRLHKRKDYYNKKFGKELIWDERSQVCNIILKIDGLSIQETSDQEKMMKEIISANNKFCEVFSNEIIKFVGPLEIDKTYPYWSKVQEGLSKTDLSCLFSYINYNAIDIGFSDVDWLYGYLTFVKYASKSPQVRCYIRNQNLFDKLYDEREEIEAELGFELGWHNGMFLVEKDIPTDPEFEDEMVQWQMATALKLDVVISKRIKEFLS